MRQCFVIITLSLLSLLVPVSFSQENPAVVSDGTTLADRAPNESERKVVYRVSPSYPPLARSTNLKGNVRLEALVTPDGKVKSVAVKGGNPVLIQAAEKALYQWKWAPAQRESREPIEMRFSPR